MKEKVEPIDISSAYVDPEDRVVDPTLLEQSLIDRMPKPTGWRMLVLPFRPRPKTKGGILLTDETITREGLATVVAFVVKMGPECYTDEKRFNGVRWCEERQWVMIGRYSGARFKLGDGGECRIINDDEVIATITDPEDIVSL
jgi:co-chaperonin GroES (HSP10)